MFREFLFLLALISAGLGCLTVIPIPEWLGWKTAILAGEFGQWIALMMVGVFALTWALPTDRPALTAATLLVSALAAVLLLKPSAEAWRIGRRLSGELASAFGRPASLAPSFSLLRLFVFSSRPGPVETFRFAPGLDLDFYPAAGRAPAPLVLVVHSGGWDGGDRRELPGFNRWLASRGYAVAAVDYRLAPAAIWPAQREDLLAALAWLKGQAGRLGIDPGRIVLFGRSSGGQLAEATAYAAGDPAIRGVVGFYAPADLPFAYAYGREDDILRSPRLLRQFLGGTPETAPVAYAEASAIRLVGKSTPPTLLMHGRLDPLVWHRQSERLAARLAEAGVPHAFVSLPWATHAFEYNPNGPGGQLAAQAVASFLGSVFR